MSENDAAIIIAKLQFAAERNMHDPELYLDAIAWIEKSLTKVFELESRLSNVRAEIGRLQAQAIY